MSQFFPEVNLSALKQFATQIAAAQHPAARNLASSGKIKRATRPPKPLITKHEDITWGGEKVAALSS
jgi:hypothetical protein